MLFNMGFVAQHIISSITAALVLVTSLNCVCRGAAFSPSDTANNPCCHEQREAETANPCCDHNQQTKHDEADKSHHGEQESAPCKHDGSGDHNPACNHCQSSLITDSSPAKNLTHAFDLSRFAPVFHTGSVNLFVAVQRNSHRFFGNLPPPVGPPTLLSLRCALNI
jgi:hypothetical protein